MGAFEMAPFDAATVALAKTAAALTKEGSLVSVAGGGDTVAALNHAGVAAISLISQPLAALSSNGWKARNCPASPRWKPEPNFLQARVAVQRAPVYGVVAHRYALSDSRRGAILRGARRAPPPSNHRIDHEPR
jgi:hypothetical protein